LCVKFFAKCSLESNGNPIRYASYAYEKMD
jgi:hypothetical protein